MIFWSLCAFIWFKNIEKMLLQMTSVFFCNLSQLPISFFKFKYVINLRGTSCRIFFSRKEKLYRLNNFSVFIKLLSIPDK
jgi:hypothetical protein